MLFYYDDRYPKSILEYAKKLEGKTFRQIQFEYEQSSIKEYHNPFELNIKYNIKITENKEPGYITNTKAKGQLGGLLEKYYFGYQPNSKQEADFPKAKIELKQTCIDVQKSGKYSAGERLSITNISFSDPVNEDFYSSHLWNKIQRILLIQYIRDKSKERLDYEIKFVNLFTPPKKDLAIIMNDYKIINDKIKAGKAHELSEGDTMYLGACTKGATAESSWIPQYYGSHELAKRRNYCFKNKYMNHILNNYILTNEVPYESIIKDENELQNTTFEQLIINRINQYAGKTDKELCELFDREYNNNKSQWITLAYRMLGIKSSKAEEFENAYITVKAIRIEENGKIKENMSFPPFKFKDLANETWEESSLYEYFETTKFLFVVFKKDGDCYKLLGSQLWNMPYNDLNVIVHDEWEAIQDTINQGILFTIKKKGGKDTVSNNLPKIKNSKIIHIRPHAKKAAYKLHSGYSIGNYEQDANELPNGEMMTTQSFWINNDYILNQLKYK